MQWNTVELASVARQPSVLIQGWEVLQLPVRTCTSQPVKLSLTHALEYSIGHRAMSSCERGIIVYT